MKALQLKTETVITNIGTTYDPSETWGGFTDQVIEIKQNGHTVYLGPHELKELERSIGAKFRR
jgi:hypothetical protein